MRTLFRSIQRCFAFLLCICLIAGSLPETAFAAESSLAAQGAASVQEDSAPASNETAGQEEAPDGDETDVVSGVEPGSGKEEGTSPEGEGAQDNPEPESEESDPEQEAEELSVDLTEESAGEPGGASSYTAVPANEEPTVTSAASGTGGTVAWSDGKTVNWSIENNKLTVSGAGNFFTVSEDTYRADVEAGVDETILSHIPWYAYQSSIRSAEVSLTDSTDWAYMFCDCTNLQSVTFTDCDTSTVTDMTAMFSGSSIRTVDFSGLDTSKVTSMKWMFLDCTNLSTVTFPSGVDTSNVESMRAMFSNCRALRTLTLSENFNTGKVKDMTNMFYYCSGLTSLTLPESFDTGNVTSMSKMFHECYNLTSLTLPAAFDTKNVTTMAYMFYKCSKLTNFTLPASFNTSNVTSMEQMFYNCNALTNFTLPAAFDTSKVTTMKNMFTSCGNLQTLTLSDSFDTSAVTNMREMFSTCRKLQSLTLPAAFDTSKVTDMCNMFYYCENLKTLTLPDHFDMKNVTNASGMFYYCKKLQGIKLARSAGGTGSFDMQEMFKDCTALETADFSHFNTEHIKYARKMFMNCENLETVTFGPDFRLDDATDLESLFDGCSALTSLDLSMFDTSLVNNMNYMFYNCSSLQTLDLSGLDTGNVGYVRQMFYNCSSLTILDLSSFDLSCVVSNYNAEKMLYGVKCPIMSPTHINSYMTIELDDSIPWTNDAGEVITCLPTGQETSVLVTPLDMSSFADIEAIAFDQTDVALFHNRNDRKTVTIKATITIGGEEEEWTVADPKKPLRWESSDTTVATVSGRGVVTALKEGTVTITAKSLKNNSVKAECTIHVTTWYPSYYRIDRASLALYLDPAELAEGEILPTKKIENKFQYIEAADTAEITWESNDPTVATVEQISKTITVGGVEKTVKAARVTGLAEGEALITVTFPDDITRTCAVTVGAKKAEKDGITWQIKDGVLTVTGSGEIHKGTDPDPYKNVPWYEQRADITSAVVSVENCKDMSYLFYDCTNLKTADLSGSDLAETTDISHIFEGCTSLVGGAEQDSSIYSLYIGLFNACKLTDMSCMFKGCTSLKAVAMYSYEYIRKDDAVLQSTASMFEGCTSLKDIYMELNGMEAKLENVSAMFKGCSALERLDLYSFAFPATVTQWTDTFDGVDCVMNLSADNKAPIPLQGTWTNASMSETYTALPTDGGVSYNYTLYGPSWILDSGVQGGIKWVLFKTGELQVRGSGDYFAEGAAHTPENVPWLSSHAADIDSATILITNCSDLSYLLYDCTNLFSAYVSLYGEIKPTSTHSMFEGCGRLQSLDMWNYSGSQLTDMSDMFKGCSRLRSFNLQFARTPNVTDMSGMFHGCSSLKKMSLDNRNGFSTESVTDMSDMFKGCSSLEEVDTGCFDTSSLTRADSMFEGCTALERLDLSSFDMTHVISAQKMVDGLQYVICSPYNVSIDIPLGEGWKNDNGQTVSVMPKEPSAPKASVMLYGPAVDPGQLRKGKTGAITWVLDKNGKLTVTGTGDYYPAGEEHVLSDIPWYACRDKILSAEIHLSGATDLSYMFYGCQNMTSVDLSDLDTGNVTCMKSMFRDCTNLRELELPDLDIGNVTDMSSMFSGCSYLEELDLSDLDTSGVTNMSSMFYGCNNLEELDLSGIDTSSVTNMSYMFYGCSYLEELDLSHFDTSSVINMSYMFYNCRYLEELDLSGFGTSRVTNMSYMFSGCNWLEELDLTDFDTSSVTRMDRMFNGCIRLEDLYLGAGFDTYKVTSMNYMFYQCKCLDGIDLSGFNTAEVESMASMFSACEYLEELDLRAFDTSRVTDFSGMFSGCTYLESITFGAGFTTRSATDTRYMFQDCGKLEQLDLSGFDTGNVKEMRNMFCGCNKLTGLDVSGFDTGKVTNMSYMFSDCNVLTGLDVSEFDTSKVTDMSYMFSGCNELTGLNVSNFDTSKVTDMSCMFYGCKALGALNVSGFDTTKVKGMRAMFSGCQLLATLDVSKFNTANVTTMRGMFEDCYAVASLDVESFDTSKVTDMGWMFYGCKGLGALNVGGFDTSKVTSMRAMFYECESLTTLDLSGFDTSNVTDLSYMINRCASLETVDVSNFNTSKVTTMQAMFYRCENLEELNVSSFDTSNVTNVAWLFGNCNALTEVDIRNFDMSKVTGNVYLFANGVDKDGDYSTPDGTYAKSIEYIYTPHSLTRDVDLPINSTSEKWYDAAGNTYTQLPQNTTESILLRRNKKPTDQVSSLTVTKEKTVYGCGEALDLDDLTVIYTDEEGNETTLDATAYRTNADAIDMLQPGEKTLTVTYKDEDQKTVMASLVITVRCDLGVSEVTVTLAEGLYCYTGSPIEPAIQSVRAQLSESTIVTLQAGKDYTVSYNKNLNVTDAAEALITGCGFYEGTVTKTFAIEPATLDFMAGEGTIAAGETFRSGLSYTVEGLKGADQIETILETLPSYTLTNKVTNAVVGDIDVAAVPEDSGEYTVTLSGAVVKNSTAGGNYVIGKYVPGKLTVVDEKGKKVSYTVTFDLGGKESNVKPGTKPAQVTVYAGDLIPRPADPEWNTTGEDALVFVGWYQDEECTTLWDFEEDTVQDNTTLYAVWAERAGPQLLIQEIRDLYYTGSPLKPAISVYSADGKTLLKAGKDYTIVGYKNNVDADVRKPGDEDKGGSSDELKNVSGGFRTDLPYVMIRGKGNYTGMVYRNFHIKQVEISDGAILPGTQTNGTAPGVTLKINDQFVRNMKGVQKPFGSIKYKKAMKAGKDFTLMLQALSAWDESDSPLSPGKNVGGDAVTPVIPKGYKGSFVLTVTGIGNYTGTVQKTVIVADAKENLIKNVSITLGKNQKSISHTGKDITLLPGWYDADSKKYYVADAALVTEAGAVAGNEAGKDDVFTVKAGKKYLVYGKDYTFRFDNNRNIGTATMTITGMGTYAGTKTVTFKITGKALSLGKVELKDFESTKVYTGKAITQNGVILVEKATGDELSYGSDYTISYSKNTKKGTATVVFTAKPDSAWSGKFNKTFKISEASLAGAKLQAPFELLELAAVMTAEGDSLTLKTAAEGKNPPVYTFASGAGNGIACSAAGAKPTDRFTLTNRVTGEVLKEGIDFTVSCANNKAVTTPGTEKIPCMTIKGKGNYGGSIQVEFSIAQASFTAMKDAGSFTVTAVSVPYKETDKAGYAYQPKVTVKDGKTALKGVLKSDADQDPKKAVGKDYTYEYVNCSKEKVKAYHEALAGGDADAAAATKPYVVIRAVEGGRYIGTVNWDLNVYKENKFAANTVYILVKGNCVYDDADGGKQLKPEVEVYYGDSANVKAAQKVKETKSSVLTGDTYKLKQLHESEVNGYTLTYGDNKTAGKNKGSVTVTGTGLYGGSVTQKFTIIQKGLYGVVTN